MKSISGKWYVFCILAISAFGVSLGLADLDYYWQADAGRKIVESLDFNGIRSQVWGVAGIGEYYDHEWLMNIIFYFFSLIPFRPVMWLKLAICLLTGFEVIRFLKEYDFPKKAYGKWLAVFVIYMAYILIFCKVKAYSVSVVLLMEEMVLIERYRKTYKLSSQYLWRLGLLCVLWTNLHSGSVPLFFVVAGVYWLVHFRTIKLLASGVVIALSTMLNPYGYKLLLFNFEHNFDDTMKSIILDWKSIDAKTVLGVLCASLVIVFICLCVSQYTLNKVHFTLGLIFVFMSLGSARHIIYLIPILFVLVRYCKLPSPHYLKSVCMYASLCIVCTAILGVVTVFTSYNYEDYSMDLVDDKLESLIYSTIDSESLGLFNDSDYIVMTEYGRKNFTMGAYPLVAKRQQDTLILTRYGTQKQVESIIEYYGLSSFIFNKYNYGVEFYDIVNPLYEYLSCNDEYECLYDTDTLVYFVRKEVGY